MTIATLRTLVLFAPLFATLALWAHRPPERRRVGAIALACCWNLASLLVLHQLAARAGWWSFEAEGGTLAGLPVDLYLGWVLAWGALPQLAAPRAPIALVVGALALVDLVAMPRFAPLVVLGPGWLAGEALALSACLLPSLALARWTVDGRHLRLRALLQATCFGLLAFHWLPTVAFEATGGSFARLAGRSRAELWIGAQILFLAALPGLSAVQEFARRGGGTPFPLDPPARLVTSGPYAYVANPMQLSIVLSLAAWGWLLRAPWVALCGASGVVFSAGFAHLVERGELDARFPERWRAWRRAVRPWIPRWRPPGAGERAWAEAMPVLYVAASCAPCSTLARWLRARRPRGLCLREAERHPRRALERLTYDPCDGSPEESGVRAFARALEHLHLGWAGAGFALRLPFVAPLAQLFADAIGFGPRALDSFGTRTKGPGSGPLFEEHERNEELLPPCTNESARDARAPSPPRERARDEPASPSSSSCSRSPH